MEQRRRLLRFAANLGVGLVMVLLGVVMGYTVKTHQSGEYIRNDTPATIKMDIYRDGHEYPTTFV